MFSEIQLKVISLLKSGFTTKQIAKELHYCERMIARHICNISNLLNVPNLPTKKRRDALIEKLTCKTKKMS